MSAVITMRPIFEAFLVLLVVWLLATPVARRHEHRAVRPLPRPVEPFDYLGALRPIGGCRPTAAERWPELPDPRKSDRAVSAASRATHGGTHE